MKTLVKVTLSYKEQSIGEPYRIEKVVNDIGVSITPDSCPPRGVKVEPKRYHVGEYLSEAQASELLYEPGVEVTTIIRK